ncbi:hypothetical protein B0T26DRAFT_717710 [Lasiosphaeria miniovina]|uniref:Secreted protein n=1 Tax=Lasiosphaeria miniovina TaxID=1954250 RepID=A0AA40ACZ8_9PEZI|nr:uncharacterized protein B0T26DRAFT_717710 [Lasiosphaeria miniovina]KAK0713537.1 hypothetical protein B0T26DRAFT_717710 [Lasiosphaeria miniovina]
MMLSWLFVILSLNTHWFEFGSLSDCHLFRIGAKLAGQCQRGDACHYSVPARHAGQVCVQEAQDNYVPNYSRPRSLTGRRREVRRGQKVVWDVGGTTCIG